MPSKKKHDAFMRAALDEARSAGQRGEIPVGAAVAQGEKILSRKGNSREQSHNPLGHAEMLAIQEAARKLGSWRLNNCALYTSLEPCLMCMGAVIQARIPLLVYACPDPKGGFSSFYGLKASRAPLDKIQIESGLRAEESAQLLQTFFKTLRKKQALKKQALIYTHRGPYTDLV